MASQVDINGVPNTYMESIIKCVLLNFNTRVVEPKVIKESDNPKYNVP